MFVSAVTRSISDLVNSTKVNFKDKSLGRKDIVLIVQIFISISEYLLWNLFF